MKKWQKKTPGVDQTEDIGSTSPTPVEEDSHTVQTTAEDAYVDQGVENDDNSHNTSEESHTAPQAQGGGGQVATCHTRPPVQAPHPWPWGGG